MLGFEEVLREEDGAVRRGRDAARARSNASSEACSREIFFVGD